jgi:RNA polymerase sigma-70 factor (ECF subfamily)
VNFQDIYTKYRQELCNFIQGKFGSGPPDPEDVAQSALLKFSELDNNDCVQNIRAFLFTTARNLVIDYHRSPKNYSPTQGQIDSHEKNHDFSDVDNPEHVYLEREKAKVVEAVLLSLPERDRKFVLMNRVDGLTYTEIAKQAGMSRSGVQKIITQALEKSVQALMKKNIL